MASPSGHSPFANALLSRLRSPSGWEVSSMHPTFRMRFDVIMRFTHEAGRWLAFEPDLEAS